MLKFKKVSLGFITCLLTHSYHSLLLFIPFTLSTFLQIWPIPFRSSFYFYPMTSLLSTLESEVHGFSDSSKKCLSGILEESHNCLNDLRLLEAELEVEVANDQNPPNDFDIDSLAKSTDSWYKNSITHLKGYNSGINKFLKNIFNNPQYRMELDEAYTYPLNLSNYPITTQGDKSKLGFIQRENHEELLKAIILHLLKIGQCNLLNELVKEIPSDKPITIDQTLLNQFNLLNDIVNDITTKHDLTKALNWFKEKRKLKPSSGELALDIIEFKFHMLQFTLLLYSPNTVNDIDNSALSAYMYSKENFSSSMKSHLDEVSALMTLLVLRRDRNGTQQLDTMKNLSSRILASLRDREKVGQTGSISFASEILLASSSIHSKEAVFTNLSNEFISEYCKDLNLSNDSSLFQCMLAGFVNLPSFYKYNKIQMKLGKGLKTANDPTVASNLPNTNTETMVDYVSTFRNDLPFQLLGASSFLFLYHPIFICPVSKEQLIPLTDDDRNSKGMHEPNPVVVLKFCHHLALRESVWQLSKRGKDYFKCHYCYKRHKFSDVKEAYFIDL